MKFPAGTTQRALRGKARPSAAGQMSSSIDPPDVSVALTAAEDGELRVLQQLLGQDACLLNATDWAHVTIAFTAAKSGHAHILQYLLDEGADPCVPTQDGTTALMAAASRGHTEVMTVLLGHRRTPDTLIRAVDKRCQTALHRVCTLSDAAARLNVNEVLLMAGADPSARDDQQKTPLDLAAAAGLRDVVVMLREWHRSYLLVKARYLHDASTDLEVKYTPPNAPTYFTYLKGRVGARPVPPVLKLVSPQPRTLRDPSQAWLAAVRSLAKHLPEGKDQRSAAVQPRCVQIAVLTHVMHDMRRELFTDMVLLMSHRP